ncbi:hypothetical protein D3C73_583060 [compost metagenome]
MRLIPNADRASADAGIVQPQDLQLLHADDHRRHHQRVVAQVQRLQIHQATEQPGIVFAEGQVSQAKVQRGQVLQLGNGGRQCPLEHPGSVSYAQIGLLQGQGAQVWKGLEKAVQALPVNHLQVLHL